MNKEDVKETEEEESEKLTIELPKVHRQVSINKPDFQLLLSTEDIDEDMNYLIKKANKLIEKHRANGR